MERVLFVAVLIMRLFVSVLIRMRHRFCAIARLWELARRRYSGGSLIEELTAMAKFENTRHIVVDEKIHERLRRDAFLENSTIRRVTERAIERGLEKKQQGKK
jgi:hypothetical protein